MPTIESVTLKDIMSAIVDELQLGDTEMLSVSQITLSVTYQVDRQTQSEAQSEDDWVDRWYEEFEQREIIPF